MRAPAREPSCQLEAPIHPPDPEGIGRSPAAHSARRPSSRSAGLGHGLQRNCRGLVSRRRRPCGVYSGASAFARPRWRLGGGRTSANGTTRTSTAPGRKLRSSRHTHPAVSPHLSRLTLPLRSRTVVIRQNSLLPGESDKKGLDWTASRYPVRASRGAPEAAFGGIPCPDR